MRIWRRISILMAMSVVSATLGSCGNARRVAAENDRLRTQAVELQDQIASLQKRNEELLSELHQAATSPGSLPEDIRANMPNLADIAIGRLSYARDSDHDGRPDSMTLYIEAEDGLGRFIQLVGPITAMAVLMPVDVDPMTIGRATFDVARVRDAYRAGITGTHYTIEFPIQMPAADAPGGDQTDVFVRVVHTDGRTGRTFTAERKINVK